jgi:hypothetical protein
MRANCSFSVQSDDLAGRTPQKQALVGVLIPLDGKCAQHGHRTANLEGGCREVAGSGLIHEMYELGIDPAVLE